MISLLDIGYAAGFYEGEGSFISTRESYGYITITQKDPEPLLKLQKLFGGEVHPYNGYNYWRLYGVECRGFVLTIFSLLSDRRKRQILKNKEFFTTPDTCPNGHQYKDGNYKMYDDSKGKSYRQCIECAKEKQVRNKNPEVQMIRAIAKARNISEEDAKAFLEASIGKEN